MKNEVAFPSFQLPSLGQMDWIGSTQPVVLSSNNNAIATLQSTGMDFGVFFHPPAPSTQLSYSTTGQVLGKSDVTSTENTTKTTDQNPRSKRRKTMSVQPPAKRSQKLGDRITSLQQLVCPFGKTDTASVLSETCVHIKQLHEKIEVLSMPYFKYGYSLQWKGREEEQASLRGRGLCLVPNKVITQKLEGILRSDERAMTSLFYY